MAAIVLTLSFAHSAPDCFQSCEHARISLTTCFQVSLPRDRQLPGEQTMPHRSAWLGISSIDMYGFFFFSTETNK